MNIFKSVKLYENFCYLIPQMPFNLSSETAVANRWSADPWWSMKSERLATAALKLNVT